MTFIFSNDPFPTVTTSRENSLTAPHSADVTIIAFASFRIVLNSQPSRTDTVRNLNCQDLSEGQLEAFRKEELWLSSNGILSANSIP